MAVGQVSGRRTWNNNSLALVDMHSRVRKVIKGSPVATLFPLGLSLKGPGKLSFCPLIQV